MPKDKKLKGPVIAEILLRVLRDPENGKDEKSRSYSFSLTARFRDKKHYNYLREDSFGDIMDELNDCLPKGYYIDDTPMSEGGCEEDDEKTRIEIDLKDVEPRKREGCYNLHPIITHPITEEEFIKNATEIKDSDDEEENENE